MAGSKLPAQGLFFPAAAVYGALLMPLSVQALGGGGALIPGLATASGHARELLLGYALAVVFGFLATGLRGPWLWLAFGAWLVARATNLLLPGHLLALAADLVVVGGLAAEMLPRLLGSIRKWRNAALPGVLLGLVAVAAGYHLTRGAARDLVILETVLLFGLLLSFMGGRVIAPALVGAMERNGLEPQARLQAGLEGGPLVCLVAALAALPLAGAGPLAGLAAAASGALGLARLARWRPWGLRGRPDLVALAAGYAWVTGGLLLLGLSWAAGGSGITALHALTVGGLGTLTATVMARTRLVRARQDPARPREIPLAALLMGVAATLRLATAVWPGAASSLLWGATLAWSLALLVVLRLLFTVPAR